MLRVIEPPTFQNFPDAIQYGRVILKQSPTMTHIYLMVHTHLIVVFRGGWSHASIYQVEQLAERAA